ncbi:MAG: prephenate dehydratase [Verrucomicrobiales bacterium]
MNLEQLRTQIDSIDGQVLELLNRRADFVHQVGEVKRQAGAEFYAPEREEQLLRRLAERNRALQGKLSEQAVRAIYREVMSAALALEKPLTIAYLGPQHSWTHQAACDKFGASLDYLALLSISDVFMEVQRHRADYGVVPIENSTEGAVSHTLDVFMESDLRICAQVMLPIAHNLAAHPDASSLAALTKVYSHPQAFGQCRNWLRTHLPEVDLIETASTTRAAELAACDPEAGAVCGQMAAEAYKLKILESTIQDSPNNATRFLVIGHTTCPRTGNDKTSLMFCVQDKVGALYAALKPFEEMKISLSKIESRPSKRKAWEYFFFVDVEGHSEDPEVISALNHLRQHCSFLKILGSYANTPSPVMLANTAAGLQGIDKVC